MSGYLHPLTDLPSSAIDYKVGWVSEPVWLRTRRKESLIFLGTHRQSGTSGKYMKRCMIFEFMWRDGM